MSQHAKIYKKN